MNRIRLIVLVLLVGFGYTVSAQDETPTTEDTTHPLLQMLSFVPNHAPFVAYVDISAVERGILNPTFPSDFPSFDENPGAWLAAIYRIQTGPSDLFAYALTAMEDMPQVVGFDFFTIDRIVSFGNPPENGVILGGDFDMDAVAEAHAAREYIEKEIAGIRAFCGNEDCDGQVMDLQNRNLANIFDPALGRSPGVYLVPGYLASAYNPQLFTRLGETIAGENRSLLASPAYGAIARALTDPDTYPVDLAQVQFAEADTAADVVDLTVFETYADYQQAVEDIFFPYLVTPDWARYGTLPPYALAAIADYHDGEAVQQAVVALAYESAEDAEIAAQELSIRVETLSTASPGSTQPAQYFIDLVEGASMDEPYVVEDEDSGYFVAVASVSYPMIEASADQEVPAGAIFRYWIQAFYRRAFSPLWDITLPDWICEVDESC